MLYNGVLMKASHRFKETRRFSLKFRPPHMIETLLQGTPGKRIPRFKWCLGSALASRVGIVYIFDGQGRWRYLEEYLISANSICLLNLIKDSFNSQYGVNSR